MQSTSIDDSSIFLAEIIHKNRLCVCVGVGVNDVASLQEMQHSNVDSTQKIKKPFLLTNEEDRLTKKGPIDIYKKKKMEGE